MLKIKLACNTVSGIPQGAVMCPMLFKACINTINHVTFTGKFKGT